MVQFGVDLEVDLFENHNIKRNDNYIICFDEYVRIFWHNDMVYHFASYYGFRKDPSSKRFNLE